MAQWLCVGRHEIGHSGGVFIFTCSVFTFGMQQQTGIITCSVGVSNVSCSYFDVEYIYGYV